MRVLGLRWRAGQERDGGPRAGVGPVEGQNGGNKPSTKFRVRRLLMGVSGGDAVGC